MFPYISELNTLVALGTIALQGVILLTVLNHVVYKWAVLSQCIARWGLHVAFATAFFAMFMSLFYSEVVGYAPCSLCWWGRIFTYPQVVIYGMGIYLNDARAALYGIALSGLGVVVSLYHYYIEMGGAQIIPCSSEAAGGVSCARVYVQEFGYVTFSMMALTVFVFLIVIMTLYYRTHTQPTVG